VVASAFTAISKIDPQEGMELAKQYENEKNEAVLTAVADLYGNYGSDEHNDFFIRSANKFKGFAMIGFVTGYETFLKKGKSDATVSAGAALLESIAKDKSTSKWVAYYAKKSIFDLTTIYDDKINLAAQKLKKENLNATELKELENQIEVAKVQKQKIMGIYNSIK
ncbi:MAG: hypothetical protein H0W84_11115, partial [Bacteroidetes bacterium]|nr:hypothetical protein [Bacteroidota bacterium]